MDVSWSLRNPDAGRLADDQSKLREDTMKIRLLLVLVGLAISAPRIPDRFCSDSDNLRRSTQQDPPAARYFEIRPAYQQISRDCAGKQQAGVREGSPPCRWNA
jgi:hypothetical protein